MGKRIVYIFWGLSICLTFFICKAYSQEFSTRGKDFWLGFMTNHDYTPGDLYLFITASDSTSGTISIPGLGYTQTFTVGAHATTQIPIPAGAMVNANNTVQNKGIHIVTNDTVSVYALNYKPYTSDATVIFPSASLDRTYRVGTVKGWPYEWGVQYLIVAIEDNTTVQITPKGGNPFNISLDTGQVYQVGSTNDLSGALVEDFTSCNPIAVFVGNVCTNIGGCDACDHLYEQILPVSRLGRTFATVPFFGKSQDYFRITAHEDSTEIVINGSTPLLLNAGDAHQFATGNPSFIQSNKPILLMQYAQGGACDGIGDPFSVMVPPLEQQINNITFNAFSSTVVTDYYVNIVTQTANTSLLTLNGSSCPFTPFPANPLYSYARMPITQGNHTLVSDSGFTAMVYGFGLYESYGYNVGLGLKNLLYDFTVSADTVCLGETIYFETQNYTDIGTYEWLFGDGNTAGGTTVSHEYTGVGTFEVSLILISTNGCIADTIKKSIFVEAPELLITGLDTICRGDTLILNADMQGLNSIEWCTGSTDSVTSVVPQSHYTYTATGILTNNPACMAYGTFDVYVIEVSAGFDYLSVCEGAPVPFNDLSQSDSLFGIHQWAWDFGDGNSSAVQNPSHVYADGGTYNVSLTIYAENGCTHSISEPVTVFYKPVVDFHANDVCLNSPTQFNNQTFIHGGALASNFEWDFGDGSPPSNAPNPIHTYTTHGTYNVQLIVTTNQGCVDSATHLMTVYDNPVASFQFDHVCPSDTAIFVNNSTDSLGQIVSWAWQYMSGGSYDSLNYNGLHQYYTSGFYDVSLTVISDNGCVDSVTKTIEVYDTPDINFVFSNVCDKDTVFFSNTTPDSLLLSLWDFGDGSPIDTSMTATHVYPASGLYTATLMVTDYRGCSETMTHDVTIFPNPEAAFEFQNTCHGLPVPFNDLSTSDTSSFISQWLWDFGDGSPVSNNPSPTHQYSDSGSYDVTLWVTTDKGCSDSISKKVTIYPQPSPMFEADREGCSEFCTVFHDLSDTSLTSIVEWEWDFGNPSFVDLQNPQKPLVCFENKGQNPIYYNVTLTVTSDKNCTASLTKPNYITVFPLPKASFLHYPKQTSIADPIVHFTDISTGAESWYWNFNDNTPINTLQNPSHIFQDTGHFEVVLTVENSYGCIDSTINSVIIRPDWTLFIPNAFSPNGDGINDIFAPKGHGIIDYEMMIFSRWGKMIFRTTAIEKGWDGRVQNSRKMCPQGVYIYKINIISSNNEKKSYVGFVTLITHEP